MNLLSIDEACLRINKEIPTLDLKYHRLLSWIKRKKHGMDKISQKIGWGWAIDGDKLDPIIKKLKTPEQKK